MPHIDPAKRAVYAKRYKTKVRTWLNNLKQKPCLDCGGIFPPCAMDFDHLRDKSENIAVLVHTKSVEVIQAEIDKCELVCSNCHRVRTYNRRHSNQI